MQRSDIYELYGGPTRCESSTLASVLRPPTVMNREPPRCAAEQRRKACMSVVGDEARDRLARAHGLPQWEVDQGKEQAYALRTQVSVGKKGRLQYLTGHVQALRPCLH